MKQIEKLKERITSLKAIAVSAIIGVSAVAGAGVLVSDQPQDVVDTPDFEEQDEGPKQISNQIDENKDKLNALSSSENSGNTEYELMGC